MQRVVFKKMRAPNHWAKLDPGCRALLSAECAVGPSTNGCAKRHYGIDDCDTGGAALRQQIL